MYSTHDQSGAGGWRLDLVAGLQDLFRALLFGARVPECPIASSDVSWFPNPLSQGAFSLAMLHKDNGVRS